MILKTYTEFLNESYKDTRDYGFEYSFNSFNLTENELYSIAEYGLLQEELGRNSGCWDDDDGLESASVCIIEDFKDILSEEFRDGWGLKGITNEFIAYRIVKLENIDSLDGNKLGMYWYTDPDAVNDDEWFLQMDHMKGGGLFLIEALVNMNQVNVVETLFRRSLNSTENELKLKPNENPKLIKIIPFEK